MKTLELKDAGTSVKHFVSSKNGAPLIIKSRGKTVAALVHLGDDDLEDFLLSNNPKFIEILEDSRQQCRRGETISSADLKKEFGIKPLRKAKR